MYMCAPCTIDTKKLCKSLLCQCQRKFTTLSCRNWKYGLYTPLVKDVCHCMLPVLQLLVMCPLLNHWMPMIGVEHCFYGQLLGFFWSA